MLSDAIDLQTIKRVLVIKLRHHGDVLLTSPVFQVLKTYAPHLEIDALIYKETEELLKFHPAISKIHVIDRTWKNNFFIQLKEEFRLFKILASRKFDLLILLTETTRGVILNKLLRITYSVALARNKYKWLWNHSFTHLYPYHFLKPRHTVEKHLDALRRIGIQPSQNIRKIILVPGEVAEKKIIEICMQFQLIEKKFIHIHPTSRWFFKTWSTKKIATLIDILHTQGEKVVLTSSPSLLEKKMISLILGKLQSYPPILLTGQLSLLELAALTARAKLFIGMDSAPMHIAASQSTPVIALFGPSGEKEWGPWMVPHRIVTSTHSCRPCGNAGCANGGISECLTTLSVEKVLKSVHRLLEEISL